LQFDEDCYLQRQSIILLFIFVTFLKLLAKDFTRAKVCYLCVFSSFSFIFLLTLTILFSLFPFSTFIFILILTAKFTPSLYFIFQVAPPFVSIFKVLSITYLII
jgi:hypothetical protein